MSDIAKVSIAEINAVAADWHALTKLAREAAALLRDADTKEADHAE